MDEIKYFLSQVKRTNGVYTKGLVIHDTVDNARQGFHAYLSAYAYGHESGTDYVCVYVNDSNGSVIEHPVVWTATVGE